jgi:hypothetical protein
MRGTALRFAGALVLAAAASTVGFGLAEVAPQDVSPDEPTHEARADDHHRETPTVDAGTPTQAPDVGRGADREVADLEVVEPRHEGPIPGYEPTGEVPTRAEASELEHQLEDFVVEGDDGLARMANEGYLEGNGTLEDPYVIEGFRVTDDLTIEDTTKPLIVRESYVEDQLTLNFVGKDLVLHHTYAEDLRVNENVERAERATGGWLVHNELPYIGQLRHFTGTFAHNDVGPRPDGVVDEYLSDTGVDTLPDEVVFLLDGYHLAHVHNNTIEGRVDVKLHGHYHGSCPGCLPHDHADPDGFPPANQPHEDLAPTSKHSYRFHTIDVENNELRAPDSSTALRLHDRAHAGDDQTAASEPNAHLEERHDHHQAVRVADNTFDRGNLVFDVVVAEDERHENMTQQAEVRLEGNEVTLEAPRGDVGLRAAYRVHDADALDLEARDNAFAFVDDGSAVPSGYRWAAEGEPAEATGFLLDEWSATAGWVNGTQGQGAEYGVTVEDHEASRVALAGNDFGDTEADRHER